MSGSKHTPGPWTLTEARLGIYINAKDVEETSGSKRIARAQRCKSSMYVGEAIANAQIIAAAPDLLAACNKALALLESSDCVCNDVLSALRAAIAKAEGRTP